MLKMVRCLARKLWNKLSARWVMGQWVEKRNMEVGFFKDSVLWTLSKIAS